MNNTYYYNFDDNENIEIKTIKDDIFYRGFIEKS